MSEGRGRPLQFLFRLLGGWVVIRFVMLVLPFLPREAEPSPAPQYASAAFGPLSDTRFHGPLRDWGGPPPAARIGSRANAAAAAPAPAVARHAATRPAPAGDASAPPLGWTDPNADRLPATTSAFLSPRQSLSGLAMAAREPGLSVPPAEPMSLAWPAGPSQDHWSAVTWMLWRTDSGAHLAQGPLLGGSQVGMRIDYRLLDAGTRSLAAYGRFSRALETPHAEEAALGLALRPVKGLPVALMVERRQKLGVGGRNGFAVLAAGGVGPSEITRRILLEGYGEAGLVGLPGAEGFVDGRLALGYRLTPAGAKRDIALGANLSGSAQRDAQRLDLGPELRLRLAVGGAHIRLSAEWRQRIAGNARPESGPAVGLIADF